MPEFNPLAAVQQGQSWIDGIFAQRANREAGAALAGGNYGQAANTLFRSGNLAAGQGVRDQQVTDQTRTRALEAEGRARQLATTQQLVRATRAVRDAGGDVAAEIQRIEPAILAMGTNPAEWNQIKASVLTNPRILDDIASTVDRELEIVNLGEGNAIAVDKANGEQVARYSAPRRPQRVAVGNDYIEVGDDGEVRPLYQGARPSEYRNVRNSDGTESVVEVGGRPAGVIGGGASLAYTPPVQAASGSGFGPREAPRLPNGGRGSSNHQGLDYPVPEGTPVSAAAEGRVTFAGPRGGYGNRVEVTHPDGRVTSYSHLANIGVEVGQTIGQGAQVGAAGSTGNSTGPHVHFEVQENGQRIDPSRVFGGQRVDAPAASNAPRVVAQGQSNGMSLAEQNAERRAQRQDRGDSRQLRRDFEALEDVQAYRTVESAYRQVDSLSRNTGNAADDIALTFSYMKMLDPGSVVREGEYALVGRAQGLTGQALVALQRIDSGQSLTPGLRAALRESAGRVLQSRRQRYDQVVDQFRGYAEEDGFDPDRVVPVTQSPTSAPVTPRLRFQPNEAQISTARRIDTTAASRRGAALGSRDYPRYLNPASPRASYNNIPIGEYYISPDGQIRQRTAR